jgi:hypothetical protein
MNAQANTKRVLPIRFYKLYPGSKFRIFAEPSREMRKSTDETIYLKVCEAYSIPADQPDEHGVKAIILDREDLVIPLSRGVQP